MKTKAKIDWDTVELVGDLVPMLPVSSLPVERKSRTVSTVERGEPRLFPDRRGRSVVKKILSGAAAKARARGAVHTHVQLRALLPAGLETLIYGWWLVVAAAAVGVDHDRDISRGVDIAAHAICMTSHRLVQRTG